VVVCVVLVALVSGCDGNDSIRPEDAKPRAVEAPLVTVDDANRMIVVNNDSKVDRGLTIRVDTSTRTERLDCGDFHVVNGEGYIQEYTSQDFFEASSEDLGNGRHREHYFLNGKILELEIDDLTGATPEQIQQFEEFFPGDPAVNSLANHPDGLTMAALLTKAEPELMTLVQERSERSAKGGLPEMQLRPKWADLSCGAASLCSMIACRISPLTNPTCWICSAVVVVCLIMDIFGWW
jgi:hypothetical protein